MRILDRYIRTQIIMATVCVAAVILGIEGFIELVRQLNDIGKNNYGIIQALIYVPMQLPADFYQLFPMVGFIGCLVGLGRMASNSELIVMQSAGVSVNRIGWSVLKTAIFMIIVVTLTGECIAPVLQSKSETMKRVALGHPIGLLSMKNVWLHQNHSFIHIDSVHSTTKIIGVTVYRFDDQNHLKSAFYAKRGIFKNNTWQLYDVKKTDFTKKSVRSSSYSWQVLDLIFNPELAHESQQEADEEATWKIFRNIMYRHRTGLVTSQFEFAFWQRIIQPLTTIVMICLGIPFVFGSLRTSTMGTRILIGVLIGFSFYMLNQFFGPITLVYQFPPLLAAAVPTLLFLMIYVLLLWKAR